MFCVIETRSVDEDKATKGREKMQADNIIYGGSVSYRNMCRFNSGVRTLFTSLLHSADSPQFFFRHPIVEKYRWYWRVEYVPSQLLYHTRTY